MDFITPNATPAEIRAAIRAGRWTAPTAGLAPGFVQTNIVILPAEAAQEFADFCELNSQACPLIETTRPGDPQPRQSAPLADLRSDVPRYRVFRNGVPAEIEPTDIHDLWRKDLVGFLLGCSFTFEAALLAEGLPVRHVQERCNVPMFRTSIRCQSAGRFSGPLVVSMRPYLPEQVERVTAITGSYPRMHGAPVHVGNPSELGIATLQHPDFGDPVPIHPGEVPVFWACGVTPQLALASAGCDVVISHSPGCMFLTDLRDEGFFEPPSFSGGIPRMCQNKRGG